MAKVGPTVTKELFTNTPLFNGILVSIVIIAAVVAFLFQGAGSAWIALTSAYLIVIGLKCALVTYRARMFNWFIFNVVLALLPVLIVMLANVLRGQLINWPQLGSSPEMYLFSALLAATTYGEYRDSQRYTAKPAEIDQFLETMHLVLMIIATLVFGLVFYQHYSGLTQFIPEYQAILGIGFGFLSISSSATFRLGLYKGAE